LQIPLFQLARVALLAVLLQHPLVAYAQNILKITLAAPGPASFSYLPIDLIKKIGADQAEGVDLDIRYQSGGPLAAKEMLDGNSDFAALGMSALATFHANGKDVRSIVTVSRAPTYVLSVRSDLRKSVKKIADLRGRVIGVHSGGRNSKSTSRQLVEFMLMRAGIEPDSVNYLPAGQSYEEQRAALASGAIDALMGEEPFSTRLKEEGLIYILADLNDASAARQALGGPFLYVQIATRGSVLAQQPEKVKRMVAIMRRTLQWVALHNSDEIARALGDNNRGNDPATLRTNSTLIARLKPAFSPDGVFRREEVTTVERFFQSVFSDDPKARSLRMTDLIDARYAGWKE
jgi:ABC-type nitrate/sulfonate/bicarbonate transport system substrate-binding protein